MEAQGTKPLWRRLLRIVVIVAVAAVLGTGMLVWLTPLVTDGRDKVDRARVVGDVPTMAAVYETQANRFRLAPDARCLLAATLLDRWLGGDAAASATAVFDGAKRAWTVSISQRPLGTLPELPGFDDCAGLLAKLAPAATGEAPAAPPAAFAAPVELLRRLRVLDGGGPVRDWDAARRNAAADTVLQLYAQSVDRAGLDDRLPATALALDVLATAATGPNPARRALLAQLLGYGQAAARYAAALPQGDAVRAYVEDDDATLRAAAAAPRAEALTRQLALRQLAERIDYAGWNALVQAYPVAERLDISVLHTALVHQAFSLERHAPYIARAIKDQMRSLADGGDGRLRPPMVPKTAAYEELLAASGTAGAVGDAPLADEFERELARFAAGHSGIVLDAALVRAYFEPYFYSAVHAAAVHTAQQWSNMEAAEAWRAEIGRAQAGSAKQFADWFAALIAVENGQGKTDVLVQALARAPGRSQRTVLFETIVERHVGFGYFANVPYVQALVASLDSRPDDVRYVGPKLRSQTHEFDMSERLIRFAVDNDSSRSPAWRVYAASLMDDAGTLDTIAADPEVLPWARTRAVNALAALPGFPAAKLDSLREAVVAAASSDFPIVSWHVEHLTKQKRFESARMYATAWMALEKPDPGLHRVVMRTLVAQTYFDEQNYEAAWQAIEPVLASYQTGALDLGAQVLDRLGRTADAEAVWAARVQRYPNSRHLPFVEYLWSKGRHGPAAAMLKKHASSWRTQDWPSDIAPAFFRALKDAGKDQAVAAVRALVDAGLPPFDLRYLSDPFVWDKKHDVALAMWMALPPGSGLWQVAMLTGAYRISKVAAGEQQAFEWLERSIPLELRNAASLVFYTEGQPELLWTLVRYPKLRAGGDWVWLTRAFADVRYRDRVAQYSEDVHDYYASSYGDLWYALGERVFEFPPDHVHLMGRVLTGAAPESELLALRLPEGLQYEVAYALALLKQCRGELIEASNWYRVVMERAPPKRAEVHWAQDQLYRWYASGRLLSGHKEECRGAGKTLAAAAG